MRVVKEILGASGLFIVVAAMSAWFTHIIWVIRVLASDASATLGQMALGAIGAFMPPVGIVHGVMIWMGYGL